jgi:hypothetical protein
MSTQQKLLPLRGILMCYVRWRLVETELDFGGRMLIVDH